MKDIENKKEELYETIDAFGLESDEALKTSQELDILITKKMKKS